MFRNLAVVMSIMTGSLIISLSAGAQSSGAGVTVPVPEGAYSEVEKARMKYQEQRDIQKDKEEKIKECSALVADVRSARGKFTPYCKEEEKTDIRACSERLDTCSQVRDEELSFNTVGTLLGIPAIPGLTGETEGVCSKYTQDKLDDLIEKAKTGVDKKQEKILEAQEKQAESEEKFAEESQKKNEEFLTQQEEKAEAELKAKEDQRNQEATFQKQQQEYEAKIRQLDDEIFSTQKAQEILIQKRRIDIANYKGMLHAARLKCTAEARKMISSLDPNYSKSGSLQSSQKKQKDVQDLYTSCMDMETSKRITDAEQFKVDMERFERQIANKNAELAAVKQSMETMKRMFAQAVQDAEIKKQKDEENFMRKQMAKWQELTALGTNMTQKRLMHMQAIQKAQADTTQASNELLKLQSQTAVGDKTPQQVLQDHLVDFDKAMAKLEMSSCDAKYKKEIPSKKSGSGAR